VDTRPGVLDLCQEGVSHLYSCDEGLSGSSLGLNADIYQK
jgi:hypothetical protein